MHGSWILRTVALSALVLTLLPTRGVLAAEPAELRVFAAAGLTAACKELGPLFEKEHPGVAVVWNFAASGALLHQLEQGAPAEVFLSADRKHIEQARQKGLTLPDSDRIFARDVVVLAVPAGNRAAVHSVQDLFTAPVRQVGLGDPATTPLGSYVKEALQQETWASLGGWKALEQKLVMGQSMPQVMSWLKQGEVDAALVFRSGVRQANRGGAQGQGNVTATPLVEEIEQFSTPRNVVFVAALTSDAVAAPAASAARVTAPAFVEFLGSPAARIILERHGFLLP